MRFNTKKNVLIGIVLSVFLLVLIFLIPFLIGLGIGYDSAMIEITINKKSNCTIVEPVIQHYNKEAIIEDIKSKRLTNSFVIKLIDCDYNTLDDLKKEIVSILIKDELCQERTFHFIVPDFKGENKTFNVTNCNIEIN